MTEDEGEGAGEGVLLGSGSFSGETDRTDLG